MNKSIGVSVVIALAALVPRCSTENTGSQTHWFDTCTGDADCGPGAACLCGVCTHTCATADDCDGLSREATCVTGASIAHGAQCGDASGAICLPSCASGCTGNEQCVDGACVVGQGPQKDASAETGGRGGTGGSSTGGTAGSTAGAGGSTGGVAGGGGLAGGSSAGASGSGGSADAGACTVASRDPLSDPFCGIVRGPLSGTVTAISQTTMCGASAVPGYLVTVQPAGMPASDVPLALGDLPQPFEVGDHLEILTNKPLFQYWLTQDLRKNGVTVVYTTYADDKQLPPPLMLEAGDDLCTTSTPCVSTTVYSLRATDAGTTVDIVQNAHADVGDFRVFNVNVSTNGITPGPSCPSDVEPYVLQVSVVRRAPVGGDGGPPTDAGDRDAR